MAYKQELWDEAKKRCHIGDEEIRMAKEMGLNPKSLIKNIPNKSEQWKAPVKDWIHDMYDKRQRKSRQKEKRRAEQLNKDNNHSIGVIFCPETEAVQKKVFRRCSFVL